MYDTGGIYFRSKNGPNGVTRELYVEFLQKDLCLKGCSAFTPTRPLFHSSHDCSHLPANPAAQNPPNFFSPTSTPDSTINGVTYVWMV